MSQSPRTWTSAGPRTKNTHRAVTDTSPVESILAHAIIILMLTLGIFVAGFWALYDRLPQNENVDIAPLLLSAVAAIILVLTAIDLVILMIRALLSKRSSH